MKTTLMLALLLLTSVVQTKRDAATFITTAQINQLLGCDVKDAPSKMGGKYCSRRSADNKTEVIVQYVDFYTVNGAASMLKSAYDGNTQSIAKGGVATGFYKDIKGFTEGGESAFYMTAPGDQYSPGNAVRTQFVLGTCMITFDTKGIERGKVIPKLGEIYKIIKGNFK
ncbi:hypothetical protein [Mucilaginibacter sp.]|uniref:hypothetical protein n=1 Tax=Mucilaginibacter sp. TaxID=1882438 RepID=UPI0025F420E6|nr:hypothetical protein [Mucilaginibacter sp.]